MFTTAEGRLENAITDAVECSLFAAAMHRDAEAAKQEALDMLQVKKVAVQQALLQLTAELDA